MIDSGSGDPSPGDHQRPPVVAIAVACEVFALALSVAANLAAVWANGWLAIAAAGAIPIVMIGATYLFLGDRLPATWQAPRPAFPATRWTLAKPSRPGAPGWAAWYANLAAAAVILIPVASASYWHQRELLIASSSPVWIATLLPLAVDGLALRAALTLFRLLHASAASPAAIETDEAEQDARAGDGATQLAADGSRDNESAGSVAPPDDEPLPVVRGIDPAIVAAAAELLAADPLIGRPALRKRFGLEDSPAKRLLGALRPMRAVEVGEAS